MSVQPMRNYSTRNFHLCKKSCMYQEKTLKWAGLSCIRGKLWSCLVLYSSVYSLSLPKVNWTQMLTTQQLGQLTPRVEPWRNVRERSLPSGRYSTHRMVVRPTGRTAAEKGPKDGSSNLWMYLEQSFLVWHSTPTLPPPLTPKIKELSGLRLYEKWFGTINKDCPFWFLLCWGKYNGVM